MDDIIKKIISKDPKLCNNWAASICYFPGGWRDSKLNSENLPTCICSYKGDMMCDRCEPDRVLLECKSDYFKENE